MATLPNTDTTRYGSSDPYLLIKEKIHDVYTALLEYTPLYSIENTPPDMESAKARRKYLAGLIGKCNNLFHELKPLAKAARVTGESLKALRASVDELHETIQKENQIVVAVCRNEYDLTLSLLKMIRRAESLGFVPSSEEKAILDSVQLHNKE